MEEEKKGSGSRTYEKRKEESAGQEQEERQDREVKTEEMGTGSRTEEQ